VRDRFFDVRAPFIHRACEIVNRSFCTNAHRHFFSETSAQVEAFHRQLEEVGHSAVSQLMGKAITESEHKIAAGILPEPLPLRARLEEEIQNRRAHIKGCLRALRIAAQPVAREVCNNLAEIARDAAVIVHERESAEAAKWSAPYHPSWTLCCLVWIGIEGAYRQSDIVSAGQPLFGICPADLDPES